MLSQAQRTTILELNTQGVSKREIARVLGIISRVAVRKVLRSNSTAVALLCTTKNQPILDNSRLIAPGGHRIDLSHEPTRTMAADSEI